MPASRFKDCDFAMLVGARPRGPGMERKDLLLENAKIFSAQGKALGRRRQPRRARAGGRQSGQHQLADRPAQCAVAARRSDFTAMTRLDHNRGLAQLTEKTGAALAEVKKVIIWGNHSATQYPGSASRDGRRQAGAVGGRRELVQGHLHSDRAAARRGGHQGARHLLGGLGRFGGARSRPRSGCSARRGRLGQHGRTVRRQLRHSAKASSTPIRSPARAASTRIVQGLQINDFSREKMQRTHRELCEERDGVKDLI